MGTVDEEVVQNATAVIGKGGTVVITGLADPAKLTVHISGTDLTLNQKTIKVRCSARPTRSTTSSDCYACTTRVSSSSTS